MQSRQDSENNQDTQVDVIQQTDDIPAFDPCRLSDEQSKEFSVLLKYCDQEFTIMAGLMELEKTKFRITNCTGLIYSKCSSSSFGYRYDILGPLLNKGYYGKIYRVLGALVPQVDGSLKLKKSQRVYKQIASDLSDKEKQRDMFNDVYQLCRNVQHLHMKKPRFSSDDEKFYTYIAMRLLPGQELYNYVNHKPFKSKTGRVLDAARSVLRAAKSQIIDARLVHSDIKPKNIIYNHTTSTAKFIDFDMAHPISKKSCYGMGTRGYMAPEVYLRYEDGGTGSTPESDIYSLGITIGELFGDLYTSDDIPQWYKNAKAEGIRNKISSLFTCCSDLSKEHQDRLECLLNEMTHTDPAKRCTVECAISVFDTVLLERAYQILRELPCFYEATIKINGALQFRDTISASMLRIDCTQPQANDHLLKEILNVARMLLNDISIDNDEIWNYMMESQDGECFIGLHNKKEVIQKIQNIESHYHLVRLALHRDLDQYKASINSVTASNEILSKAQDFLIYIEEKIQSLNKKYSASLDNIIIVTKKLEKYYNRLLGYQNALQNAIHGTPVNPLNLYGLFKQHPRQQAQPANAADHSSTLL